MDKNLFQEAKDKITNLTNKRGKGSDHEAVQRVIDSIHRDANPEQRQQLEELKQQIEDNDALS